MNKDFNDLLSIQFLPLSEVKAKLSELVNTALIESKRVGITTNGRPTAVLISYSDFLSLLKLISENSSSQADLKPIDFKEWEKQKKDRTIVRDSIFNLFDLKTLSRKGQKTYKRDTVREFDR